MLDRCATVELLPTALWAPHLCHLGPCRVGAKRAALDFWTIEGRGGEGAGVE